MPRAHWLPRYLGNSEPAPAMAGVQFTRKRPRAARPSRAHSPMEIPAVQPHYHPALGQAGVVSLEVPHVLELALCHGRPQFQTPFQNDGSGSQAIANLHVTGSPHSRRHAEGRKTREPRPGSPVFFFVAALAPVEVGIFLASPCSSQTTSGPGRRVSAFPLHNLALLAFLLSYSKSL